MRLCWCLLLYCGLVNAFTDKPIHVIFGLPPGSTHQLIFNTLVENAPNKKLNFVSESKPGLSGAIAHQHIAQSKPDGQTIGFVGSSIVINPIFIPNVTYNAQRDFDSILYVAETHNALVVRSGLPFNTPKDILSFVTNNPQKLSYGHNGEGSSTNTTVEDLFKGMLLPVPYKGTNFIILDLLGGQIDLAIIPIGPAIPLASNSKIKIVATTGTQRFKLLNVPTIRESIKPGDFAVWDRPVWYGFVSPKGINRETLLFFQQFFTSGITEDAKNKLERNGITLNIKDLEYVIQQEQSDWNKFFARKK